LTEYIYMKLDNLAESQSLAAEARRQSKPAASPVVPLDVHAAGWLKLSVSWCDPLAEVEVMVHPPRLALPGMWLLRVDDAAGNCYFTDELGL
jgi:hypothetical protein